MRPLFTLAALAALTVACGGNTPTSPSLPPNPFGGSGLTILTRGTVRATVDGVRWESTVPSAGLGTPFAGTPPLLTVSAGFGGASLSQFSVLLVSGPLTVGTHTLGGGSPVTFSLSQDAPNRWTAAPFSQGSSGTLTITTATPTRVAGTFSFTAPASTPGLIPATRTVTDGTFDVSQ